LNLSEILPVYLVDKLYLAVVVTNWRQSLHIWSVSGVVENYRKFAVVSRGICQTGPLNLEKFAAENCGPYCSELAVCWPKWYTPTSPHT